MELFVFHWGCIRLGALEDGQRGPTFDARGGTEYVLHLHYIFMLFPNGLVPSDGVFRTARNEKPSIWC